MDLDGEEQADEQAASEVVNDEDKGTTEASPSKERPKQTMPDTATDAVELENPVEAPVKIVKNPADPTPEERTRHNCTHVPYRPWCRICVEAWAREDPHYSQTQDERDRKDKQGRLAASTYWKG